MMMLQEILLVYEYCRAHRLEGGTESTRRSLPATITNQADSVIKFDLPKGNSGKSVAAIRAEFEMLDLQGEGRISFLAMRTALELSNFCIEDGDLRKWFKAADKMGKGIITLEDYQAMYSSDGELSKRLSHEFHIESKSSADVIMSAKEKKQLLKSAFSKFDINRDGFISADDLRSVFESQGRTCSDEDILRWIQKRDTSELGAVSFADFCQHFQIGVRSSG